VSDERPGRTRFRRVRLAGLLMVPALLALAVALIPAPATRPAGDADVRAGAARIEEGVVVVIVADGEGGAVAVGTGGAGPWWIAAASAAALAAAGAVAWIVSGRVLRLVDRADTAVAAADEQRSSRLQEVVHELRTPLAVMGTNLELAAESGGEPEAAGYIDAARRAVDRMGRTVDDLAGHGELAVEQDGDPADLSSIAGAVVAEHAGPARTRGIHLLLTGSSQVAVPAADPAAVRTTLGNFVANSVRLAPRGSAITVDWGETAGWAWAAVTDEGPGLAPHHHARAFERGWQGPHDRDRSGGSGLGLTIARQLTEAQGGAVTIESEEGGGTTMTAWLPLGHDADERAVVAPDRIHPAVRPWQRETLPA
jgi:signal transduction histidine kinase